MTERHTERRTNDDGKQRKLRVATGSASAPIAIIVSYVVYQFWGKTMTTEVMIAISTLMGSLVSVLSVCFWDLRGIVLSRLYKRRRTE